ncbi:energy transducer TonB [Nostoc ellipsosporum NOK]|nr:energy transducer TonB [Nostoc ellipsosporum NOK]
MDTNKILTADVLDILFEGRNKSYGAYDLRKTYSSRLKKALLITGLVVAGIVASAAVLNNRKTVLPEELNKDQVTIREFEVEPEEKKPEPVHEEKKVEEPQEQLVKPLPLKTIASTPPVIVDDDQVKSPPPAQDDLKGLKIDLKSNPDGVEDKGIANLKQSLDKGTGILTDDKKKDDAPFEKVEVEASFIGGPKAWENFLRRNLDAEVPPNNGAPEGKYTVLIQFVVDENGAVSDLKPLTQHGFGMEQEAMRVLKKATKWTPAQQNGRFVKAYRRQPITFEVAQN